MQSRYYDPAIGRFINADALVSTGKGVLGNNMFAYCGNNTANCIDPSGYKWRFWRALFEDHRPGYIHWAVEAHIVLGGIVDKELVLLGVGRVDIFKPETGEIWEIKYGGSSETAQQKNTEDALNQLLKYLNNKNIPLRKGAAGAFEGEFVLNCNNCSYLVTYTTPQEGVILYFLETLGTNVGNAFAVYPDLTPFARKNNTQSYAWLLACGIPILGTKNIIHVQEFQDNFII